MFIVESKAQAILFCVVTMLCWGSWANTQKLSKKEWRFQLFYWDYAIGVVLLALIFGLTLGSQGTAGRGFFDDLSQASSSALTSAVLGGVIFNFANLLLVAAIDIAGLAVAFPVGIGIALVQGVIVNYVGDPRGNIVLLSLGVLGVAIAIVVNAIAYRKLPSQGTRKVVLGLALSIIAGISMGWFYRFVADGMSKDFVNLEPGKMGPYAAVFVFSLGILASNFLWNTIVMVRPFVGEPVPFRDYFTKGTVKLHAIGILGGLIWNVGMSFNIIASGNAGTAVAYGLGQGATMVAAFWGVFIWKEFRGAPVGTGKLLAIMFVSYLAGLGLIIAASY